MSEKTLIESLSRFGTALRKLGKVLCTVIKTALTSFLFGLRLFYSVEKAIREVYQIINAMKISNYKAFDLKLSIVDNRFSFKSRCTIYVFCVRASLDKYLSIKAIKDTIIVASVVGFSAENTIMILTLCYAGEAFAYRTQKLIEGGKQNEYKRRQICESGL